MATLRRVWMFDTLIGLFGKVHFLSHFGLAKLQTEREAQTREIGCC